MFRFRYFSLNVAKENDDEERKKNCAKITNLPVIMPSCCTRQRFYAVSYFKAHREGIEAGKIYKIYIIAFLKQAQSECVTYKTTYKWYSWNCTQNSIKIDIIPSFFFGVGDKCNLE